MQRLLFLLLLTATLAVPLSGQFLIENAQGTIATSPMADDVNVCFDRTANLQFRLIATDDVVNPMLDIALATGREYLDGTISVVAQSSSGVTIGPNTGTATNPSFSLMGNINTGEFVQITLRYVATCDAINQNGLTHEVSIAGVSEISSTHDATFLTLSIGNLSAETIGVGQSGTATGSIVGGGNGCVEDVVFRLFDDAGTTTTELRVEGNVITADSVVGLSRYYTLSTAEITQVGNGDDCFDALEMLNFERDISVSSCEVDAGYEASWGCFGETCTTTGELSQQINIPSGIPDVEVTASSIIQRTNLCPGEPAIVEFTLTNNGTGAGTAFNIIPVIHTDAGQTTSVFRGGQSFTNFVLNNNTGAFIPVTTTGGVPVNSVSGFPALRADFSTFAADPDGPGGLDDLDGDGQFDDLPVGASITYRVDWNYLCQQDILEAAGNCGPSHSGGPATSSVFNNQCGDNLVGDYLSVAGFTNRFWTATSQSPNDVEDGGTFPVTYFWTADRTRINGQGLVDCPNGYLRHVITLPTTDFSYVPGSAAYNTSSNDGIIVRDSVSPDGLTLIIDINRTGSQVNQTTGGNLNFEFLFNCGTSGFYAFEVEQYWVCDESCNTCLEPLTCEPFGINAFCPDPCGDGGLTIVASTGLRRTTTGFVSPLDETRVDAATLTDQQLQYGMPHDTFVASYNGVNFADSVGTFFENGQFSLSYGQLGGGNLLDPEEADVEIYRNGVLQTTCTVPAAESISAGRHIINYDFAACGYTFGMGDSVALSAPMVIVKNSSLTTSPQPINSFRSTFYSLNAAGDTVSCSFRTGDLYLHTPVENYRSSLGNYSRTGCGEYNPNLAVNWGAGPFDPYPNEIRPYSRPDSLKVTVTGGDRFTAAQRWPLNIGNYGDDSFAPNALQIDLRDFATWNADSTEVIFVNDGSWPLGDLYGSIQTYRVQPARIINSCQTGNGSGTAGVIWEWYSTGYYYAYNEDCYEPFDLVPGERESERLNNSHVLPQHELVNLTGTYLVTSDTAVWEVEVRNLTNIESGYIFLGFLDAAAANVDIIQARDVAADTLIPLLPYVDGDWIKITDEFGAAENLVIELTGIVAACEDNGIQTVFGFDCADFPTDPTDYPCELDTTTLNYRVLNSQVQIGLEQQPTPFPICSVARDTITITSALDGYVTDLLLQVPLPAGLMESDLMIDIEYPANSGNRESFPLVLNSGPSGDTAIVDLMQHSIILAQNGIPGTQGANTQEEAQAQVFFTWISACDFIAGSTYMPTIFANRPCGEPAIDNGVSTTSDPLLIVGAEPPFLAPIDIELDIDTIKGCATEMVNIDALIAVGSSTPRDTVYITLPIGVEYDPNSFNCTAADQSACPTLVGIRTNDMMQDVILLALPDGINGPTEIPFSLDILASNQSTCNEEAIIQIDVISSAPGVFCATIGMDCDGIQILTGSSNATLYFQKPEIMIDTLTTCLEDGTFTVAGQVSVMTVDIDMTDSLEVDVYCSTDLNNPIHTFVINGPIVEGMPMMFNNSFDSGCTASDSIFLSIDLMNSNCICEPADTLVPIEEAIVVTISNPVTICQTKPVVLADLMASIVGSLTSGTWSTSGDGSFSASNDFPAAETYTPGATDIANGTVSLTLTSDDPPGACTSEMDEVTITILMVDCGTFFWDGSND